MTDLWTPNPEDAFRVPEPIEAAARFGELVVFIGAGVSALCESPLWDAFANQMIDELGANDGGLSFVEQEQLKAIQDPRRKASIAVEFAKRNGIKLSYESMLHPQKPSEHGLEAYRLLAAMNPAFVTTNYDTWLDRLPPVPVVGVGETAQDNALAETGSVRGVYCVPQDITFDRLNEQGAVVHLHGSCTNPESMVLSLRDYIDHYSNDHIKAFLRELFEKRCVLFMGYSLAELEILEYLVRFNPLPGGHEDGPFRHYLLYAYRSSEVAQLRFLKHYFERQCGVRLIPYCIDKEGFRAIVPVLRRWNEQLDVRSPALLDREAQVDRVLEHSGEKARRDGVIRMIAEDESLAAYFFSRAGSLDWLEDLATAGFFEPARNPRPSVDAKGHYWQFPRWPALTYLERASKEAERVRDLVAASRILGFVEEITQSARANGIDNPHTGWSLAEILASLPVDAIELKHVELARVWLETRFDASMIGHVLARRLLPRLLESDEPLNHQKAAELVDILTTLKEGERHV